MILEQLRHPVVLAPLAGGPSAPALAAAVSEAGGLGFLAAGYRTAEAMDDEIREVRAQTTAPFGVNLFVPGRGDVDERAVLDYLERLREEATRYGDAASAVGAWARLADLHLAFAQKLDGMPAPVDVQAPDARSDYRRQMRQLMSTFEIEAALAAARALDAAGVDPAAPPSSDPEAKPARLAAWVRTSCEKLAVLDPDSLAGYPACAGAGGPQ